MHYFGHSSVPQVKDWHESLGRLVEVRLQSFLTFLVNFMPRPRYLRKKFSRYPLYRKVIWAQSVRGCCREQRSLLHLPGKKNTAPAWLKWERHEIGFIALSVVIIALYIVCTVNRLRAGQTMNRWSISSRGKKISFLQSVRPSVRGSHWGTETSFSAGQVTNV